MRWAGVWLAAAVAALAGCARTYEIRLTRPLRAGAEYRLEGTGEIARELSVSSGAQTAQQEKSVRLFALAARVRVLGVDEKGRETQVSLLIEKCVSDEDGKRCELLAQGTVVTGRVEERREVFAVEGAAVGTEAQEALELFVSLAAGGPTDDEVFGTPERVRVGDVWPVNVASAAADARREGLPLRDEDVSGQVTLAETTAVDGVACLRLRGVLAVAQASLPGLPQGMDVRQGELRVEVSGVFPVDTSEMRRASSVKQTLKVTAVGREAATGPVMTVDLVMRRGSKLKLSPVE